MQEFISVLKLLLTSNFINFIIMLYVLAYVFKKFNLGNGIDASIEKVKDTIIKSDEEKAKAGDLVNNAKALLENLPKEVKDIEDIAKNKTEVFKNKIEADTNKIIANLEDNIGKAISIEEKKVSNLLTDKTSKASIELAKLQIQKMLKENPDLHNKFILDSLDEFEKVQL